MLASYIAKNQFRMVPIHLTDSIPCEKKFNKPNPPLAYA